MILAEGAKIQFNVTQGQKDARAANVRLLEDTRYRR
jgi:cold shock CspA family protein